jgi:sugar phosphate isomerase/epimerase
MKIGLYSITYLGVWYDGAALTLDDVIRRAAKFGYDGVEIDGKRPHGHPMDMPASLCQELHRKASDAGIDLYAVAANNDFSSPISEHRESQLGYVKDLIRMTSDLGAGTLRIFAAWPGVHKSLGISPSYEVTERIWAETHKEFPAEQIWDWCRDGLIESARWAADAGIVLALQNHPAVIDNYHDMLRMIREVNSPNLKAAFDAPMANKQGVTRMRDAAAEVGSLQVLTHFGGEYEERPDGEVQGFVRWRDGRLTPENFYSDFAAGMLDIGYNGYTGYELCHPLPSANGKPAGIDFADKNARLAAKFMRRVLKRAHDHRAAAAAVLSLQ